MIPPSERPEDYSMYTTDEPDWLPDPPVTFRFLKRTFDISFSLFALILFAPLLLIIAFLIKSTSKGPVLFRETRLGYHGDPFLVLKFRSMYDRSDRLVSDEYVGSLLGGAYGELGEQPAFKVTNDPRLTPVGRFLRKTSLDELPQLLNVLQGHMSLVGPRPPILYEYEAYQEWHKQRLSCKPGITGLWQIQGKSSTTFDDLINLDLYYIKHQSLWLDIKILLRTPSAVLGDDRAF
jgi:lipopolysaccharide/colanic/teichoic acid biosynthesis glycosyltransferase